MSAWFTRTAIAAAAVITTTAAVGPLHANPLRFDGSELAIEHTVGEGDNTAYLVLDYDASEGGIYAFAYHWSDPTTTGEDMIYALTAATSLEITATDYGSFIFIDGFYYNDEQPDSERDWATYSWDQATMGWIDTQVGLSELILSDGPAFGEDAETNAWVIGLHQSWLPDWSRDGQPRATAIPEPTSLALLTATASLVLLRRRHRHA